MTSGHRARRGFGSLLLVVCLLATAREAAGQSGPIPRAGWTITFVDSQDTSGGGAYLAPNAIDGNPATFWHTQWAAAQPGPPHEIRIDLGGTFTVDGFRYLPRQDGFSNGRIAQYQFHVSTDGVNWGSAVAIGTLANVATEQEVQFSPKVGRHVRLRALSEVNNLPYTAIAELNVLGSGNAPPNGTITAPAGPVTIEPGQTVTFTGSASDPENNLPFDYFWDFGNGMTSTSATPGAVPYANAGVYQVTFTVTDSLGAVDPTPATRTITVQSGSDPVISRTNWSVTFVDSQDTTGGGAYLAQKAIDGNTASFWHTQWAAAQPPPPHEIRIDMGASFQVSGFRYLPRQDGFSNGRIAQYEFYVSADGVNWGAAVAAGTFANVATHQEVQFAAKTGRFIRLRALSEVSGLPYTAVAELFALGVPAGNQPPNGTITEPASNVTILAGESVVFAGSGTDPDLNHPLAYSWNFGNGATASVESPGAQMYTSEGVHTVTFTVTDSLGLPDPTPATRTVTVLPGASPAASLIPKTGWTLHSVDNQASSTFAATKAFDGQANTFWHTSFDPVAPLPHHLQIDLGASYSVAGFRYLPRQDHQSGRIGEYEFYVSTDGTNWGAPVAAGAFPDFNGNAARDVMFPAKTGRYVSLRVFSEVHGDAWTALAELDVFRSGTAANDPPNASLLAPASALTVPAGATLRLLGSATDPNGHSLTYRWGVSRGSGVTDRTSADGGFVQFDRPGVHTVTFAVTDSMGLTSTASRTVTVVSGAPIPQGGWSLVFADSQSPGFAATNAFDGNPATFWHTQWTGVPPPPPHEIQIDLGATYEVSGFRYLPRQDGSPNGNIGQYNFYVSTSTANWGAPVVSGAFFATSVQQEVASPVKTGRFVRLQALTEANGLRYTSIAELQILQRACVTTPSVVMSQPQTRHLQTTSSLTVHADACLAAGQGVRFVVDGGAAQDDYTAPYEAAVSGLVPAEHLFEAQVIDASGQPVNDSAAYDRATQVGVGDYYLAIGDGITLGLGDEITADDNSQDGRNMKGGGFTPILSDLLTAARQHPVLVANETLPGKPISDWIAAIGPALNKHPNAQYVLIMNAHNDSRVGTPSGLGLQPGNPGYAGSYKANMQFIINAVLASGKIPILAKAPGILPGTDRGDDELVQAYNQVIDELVLDPANEIPIAPPDFYTHFKDHPSELFDEVLPNGVGYQSMAQIWLNALE